MISLKRQKEKSRTGTFSATTLSAASHGRPGWKGRTSCFSSFDFLTNLIIKKNQAWTFKHYWLNKRMRQILKQCLLNYYRRFGRWWPETSLLVFFLTAPLPLPKTTSWKGICSIIPNPNPPWNTRPKWNIKYDMRKSVKIQNVAKENSWKWSENTETTYKL